MLVRSLFCGMKLRWLSAGFAAVLAPPMATAAIITDTFNRPDASMDWGSLDNGVVNGQTGSVAADYTLDGGVGILGNTGAFANNRVVLDYNLATDVDVVAGGGFRVYWEVNPTDGDDSLGDTGSGREFAGIALGDSNQNPPYGGAGALTNTGNTTLRYAILPRNSGSAGTLTRTTGNTYNLEASGNPSSAGFNEQIFDQATFDAYVNDGTPDPFVNPAFYAVELTVLGDFTAGSDVTIRPTVNGTVLDTEVVEWGVGGQAYLSAIGFNGVHRYDNLSISALTAIPEPGTASVLAVAGCLGGVIRRRRR